MDTEIQVPGYTFVRNDRSDGKKGGGVMAFVRDEISYRARPDLSSNHESCMIEITRPKCKKLVIWTVIEDAQKLVVVSSSSRKAMV